MMSKPHFARMIGVLLGGWIALGASTALAAEKLKIVVSRGARTLTAEEEHSAGKEVAAAIDQHAWLDPRNGAVYVRNIADALARSDPANAADYRARAARYAKEIESIEALAKSEIA